MTVTAAKIILLKKNKTPIKNHKRKAKEVNRRKQKKKKKKAEPTGRAFQTQAVLKFCGI